MKVTRYTIERYSPSRKDWVDFKITFDDEEKANERATVLNFDHRREGLKFRVTAYEYDDEKPRLEKQIANITAEKEKIAANIKELKHDPVKEEIKAKTKEKKALEKEEAELMKKLAELEKDD